MEWPRGEATACKAVYTGSNPVSTSHERHDPLHRNNQYSNRQHRTGDWRSLASALP